MTRDEKLALLKASEGKIFSISFTKADGSVRRMQARLGVNKHLRGGKDSTAHLKQYLNVFDMQKQGYRKVNLDTLKMFKYGDVEYNFEEN